MSSTHNILVISDLHLGEDLQPNADSTHLEALEAELVAFIEHYRLHRRDGLPWRLIVNGDMVDFLGVCLMPDEAGVVSGVADEDWLFGLGTRPVAAVAKIEKVLERHRALFLSLARFLGEGHALSLVVGNHDVEFHWPQVQQRMRETITELWAEHREPGSRTVAEVESEIQFHPWFYYEEGLLWIEHGHQYDGYCSFDHILDPADPTAELPMDIEQNLGTVAMRYIGNFLDSRADETNDLGFFAYLAMLGDGRVGFLLGGYARMIGSLFYQYLMRWLWPAAYAQQAARHRKRLAELASKVPLAEDTLHRLHELRVRPVYVDLSRLMASLMLGRVFLIFLALAALPTAWLLVPWSATIPVSLGIVTTIVAFHVILSVLREDVDPTAAMTTAAGRIAGIVRTPLVVFGHSHVPVVQRVGRSWYFNTGTWAGGPDRQHAFSHLMVTRAGQEARAALCRWAAGESRELRSEVAARAVPAPSPVTLSL